MINGNTLIAWGFKPGRWFKEALDTANTMRTGGADDDAIFAALEHLQPLEALMRTNGVPFAMLIAAENELERANIAAVSLHMDAASVRSQIKTFGLGEVIDEVIPYGSIMAGERELDAPWRKRR